MEFRTRLLFLHRVTYHSFFATGRPRRAAIYYRRRDEVNVRRRWRRMNWSNVDNNDDDNDDDNDEERNGNLNQRRIRE